MLSNLCSAKQIQALLSIPSPCYVLEEQKLENNINVLNEIQQKSGAKILLALKGYAFWRKFDCVRQFLKGSTASGLYEARLGFESIGGAGEKKEVCVFSPAYKEAEFKQILNYATHIIFNSFAQWQKFKPLIESKNKQLKKNNLPCIEVGLRVNPLYSEVKPDIYNPCVVGSRLGIIPSEFDKGVKLFGLDGIDGLHFHTHCEQDSHALQRTLPYVEKHFGAYLQGKKWINFGGGHHITRKDYDKDLLVKLVLDFKARFNNIEIFLEPGEAVGWQVGFLIGEVIDIVHNGLDIAIVDVSASVHMPDCLEMPYRPSVWKLSVVDSSLESDLGENVGEFRYRLGGPTCLAGDVIGDYSFKSALNIGDRVLFGDMLHYTIVKNNTFNGIPLPSLGSLDKNGNFTLLKTFSYDDYKQRN